MAKWLNRGLPPIAASIAAGATALLVGVAGCSEDGTREARAVAMTAPWAMAAPLVVAARLAMSARADRPAA